MSAPVRLLLALIAGLAVGMAVGDAPGSVAGQFLTGAGIVGNLWLDALRMTIVPLVFCLVVIGIASASAKASTGHLPAWTLLCFLVLLTVAAIVGITLTPFLLGIWPPPEAAAALQKASAAGATVPPPPPLSEWIGTLIPSNPVAAAAEGSVLQLTIFGILFGFALAKLYSVGRDRVMDLLTEISDALMIIVQWVLVVAPIGVFGLAVNTGAHAGLGAIGALAHYVTVVSLVCIALIIFAYPVAVIGGRLSLARFARAAAQPQIIAFSTQSSLATLPAMLEAARTRMGIPPQLAGFALPMATAMFRVTSPAANLAMVIYIGYVAGVPLTVPTLITGAAVAVAISLAGAGVASAVTFFATATPICMAMGVPLEMLALLIAVEAIPDLFRTVGNVTMNLAVTALVSNRFAREDEEAHAST